MVAGSFTDENVYHVAPARLWKALALDIHNLAPKLLPEVIASVDIVEGDGGVGTVRKVTFGPAIKEEFTFLKERIDVIDHENYVFKYTVLEGGLLGIKLKAYSFEFKVEATGDGGAKTKLKVDYDSLGEGVLSEEDIGKIIGGMVAIDKAFEGYLIQNPDAYT